jgi:hypothetical protein
MRPQPYIVAIMLFAIINGIFSPFIILIFPFVLIILPAFFATYLPILFFISSLLLSTLTLILGGIPAALYERFMGAKESTEVSMWIWLAGVGVLTLPAAGNFFRIGF